MITIQFTCHECGLIEEPVEVPERGPGQDVKSWLDNAQIVVGAYHTARSPECLSTTCDLKIPLPHGTNVPLGSTKSRH